MTKAALKPFLKDFLTLRVGSGGPRVSFVVCIRRKDINEAFKYDGVRISLFLQFFNINFDSILILL